MQLDLREIQVILERLQILVLLVQLALRRLASWAPREVLVNLRLDRGEKLVLLEPLEIRLLDLLGPLEHEVCRVKWASLESQAS